MRKIVVGTRKSKLALFQTKWVIDRLKNAGVQNQFEIKEFLTKGDQNLNVALSKVGGSGIFIKEMEQAIQDQLIDFAVHSLKDVPTTLPDDLVITSFPVREDHRDAFLSKDGTVLNDLPTGAVVGTSSTRRSAQILARRPDIKTKWIRGTVGSRIQQLHQEDYDAIILAVAGIKRLGLSEEIITEYLESDVFVPAVGQGALAIECRGNDSELRNLLATINDTDTETAVLTERQLVDLLDDSDQAPIGSYAYVENNKIVLQAAVVSADGKTMLHEMVRGEDPVSVANEAAEKLMKQGANEIIDAFKEEHNG